jgi:glycerol-3-phosphate acyltransferase PlsY
MLRLGGWPAGALTLLGDGIKGILPVLLAREYDSSATIQGLCGLFAVLGHLYPIFFEFRGGKGVATALGAAIALHWQAGLILLCLWMGFFALTRIASVASLASWILAPAIYYLLAPIWFKTTLLLCFLVLYRHKLNLTKLYRGEESPLLSAEKFPKTSSQKKPISINDPP